MRRPNPRPCDRRAGDGTTGTGGPGGNADTARACGKDGPRPLRALAGSVEKTNVPVGGGAPPDRPLRKTGALVAPAARGVELR